MAFDKTLPTNSTKIRNYPTVLTDNWSGIQTGDLTFKVWQLNFADRDLVPGAPPPAQDPTRDDDTMIVFSKQNSSGETDLFVMDDRNTANIIQITENGRMGGATTNISMDNFTFTSGTTNYNENNIINAHGRFNSAGTAIYVNGCTVVRNSTGVYTVTFSTARANVNYSVTANADNSGNARICKIGTITTASFKINIVNGDGALRDAGCSFMVVGGL